MQTISKAYDLINEAKDIQPGYSKGPFLCEGCGYIYLVNIGGIIRVDCLMSLPSEEEDIDQFRNWDLFPTLDDFLKLPMPEF